jgi:hypothetical protein
MIVAGSASPLLLASAAGGYNLTRSLRFRKSASAKLTRTPSTAGNRRTFTASMWLKRGLIINVTSFLSADTNGGSYPDDFQFYDNKIAFFVNGSINGLVQTQAVFRDPSAWYHVVLVVDTTQATDTNRVKIYVNGVQQTTTGTYPTLNYQTYFNSVIGHQIGNSSPDNNYFDGYMAEINYVDGQALTPSSFGANSPTTGVWQPKKYAGTYGTNGFYLPFTNNASTTTLGNDFSGNGNNWTTNNISLTAGSTYDSMTDVPTLTSATAANFATWNPLKRSYQTGGVTHLPFNFSNGNLTVSADNNSSIHETWSTIGVSSGKWYWEVTVTQAASLDVYVGAINGSFADTSVGSSFGNGAYQNNGVIQNLSGTLVTSGSTYTNGDIIGVALDCTNGTVQFYKNNVAQGATPSYTFTSGTLMFAKVNTNDVAGANILNGNFGQRPFAYTPPTGFVALNTFNLPEPTIGATASTQANKYMDATLYTGTGATLSVTNAGSFSPDLVWLKIRSTTGNQYWFDTNRGVYNFLLSDGINAETNATNTLTAFNSNGFTLGTSSGTNPSGGSMVAWQWRGSDSTAVTNTAGSITSTVSANTSAGFSVVTWTGTGSTGTVGHGLGVAPAMIITKMRNGTTNWNTYHRSLGNTSYLELNTTNAVQSSGSVWNSTTPTSTIFGIGAYGGSDNLVAYCFSEVAGYSKFGSYTGNGSTDGTFIYTGFKPRYIMIKRTDSTGQWVVVDTARSPSNVVDAYLFANLDNAEASSSSYYLDILSNGWKIRGTISNLNASGGTYTYMAFAENPYKYSLAR